MWLLLPGAVMVILTQETQRHIVHPPEDEGSQASHAKRPPPSAAHLRRWSGRVAHADRTF